MDSSTAETRSDSSEDTADFEGRSSARLLLPHDEKMIA